MRRTLSAGSSPASVRDCSPRPSAPPRLKVGADLGEDMPQFLNRLAVEHTAAVFGDEDQMDMHCKDAVSTVPNFLEVRHRPNHNGTLERGKGSNSSCCRTVNSNGRRAVRLVAPVTSTTRRWLSSKSDTKGRGPPVFERHQQKPGRGVYRRPSSKEYVGVGQGQEGEAGKAGSPEVGTQPFDSGRQPVRTAAPAGVQDAVEGRSSRRRAAPEHKPQVS